MLNTLSFQAVRCARRSIRTMALRTVSTQVPSIRASQEEVRLGRLNERNLEQAVRAVHEDGLVVVENAIAHEQLDRLNRKMVSDAMYLADLGENSPFNYNKGNLQQDAPPFEEYFEPSIFLSESLACASDRLLNCTDDLATHITSAVLGPKPKLTFMSGNSAMPPTAGMTPQRQPVHSDADFAHPQHPFALVVNVPLVMMTPENGSTEVWLGTHSDSGLHAQEGEHGDRASGRIKQQLLDERSGISPPLQPIVPKGSIIVRDLRLWHAGMPNLTQDPRVMLAMSE